MRTRTRPHAPPARRLLPALLLCAAALAALVPHLAARAQAPRAPQGAEAPAQNPARGNAQGAANGARDDAGYSRKTEISLLRWYYNALKPRYTIAFLFLSLAFVALLVMNLLSSRRETIVPLSLVEAFEAHLNEKNYQGAYELAKSSDTFLGRMLAAGLAKLASGYDKAMAAMQEIGDDETMRLEHRLSYLALIGTIAPMVGLLGTVDGMIVSFDVIAGSDTQPRPSQLAQGISMALVTTLVGLWLAIPAIAIYNLLRNRVQRLTLEVGIIGEGLMSRFDTGVKK